MTPNLLYKFMGIPSQSGNFHSLISNNTIKFSVRNTSDKDSSIIQDITNWDIELINQLIKEVNDFFRETIYKQIALTDISDIEQYQSVAQRIINLVNNNIRVSSFVLSPYNLYCWKRYSHLPHQGVCLEFDTTNDDEIFQNIVRLKYSDVPFSLNYKNSEQNIFETVLSRKSVSFSDENEFLAYSPSIEAIKFRKTSLKSIIFGCMTKDEEIKYVKNVILENDYENITLKKLFVSKKDFDTILADTYKSANYYAGNYYYH